MDIHYALPEGQRGNYILKPFWTSTFFVWKYIKQSPGGNRARILVISSISCITVIIWLLFWRQLIIGPQIFPPRRISPRSNCFLGPRPIYKYYGQPWLPWAEICWKGWMKILVTSRQCWWQNHHTTDTTRQWEKWIWVRVHKVTPKFRDVLKIAQVWCLWNLNWFNWITNLVWNEDQDISKWNSFTMRRSIVPRVSWWGKNHPFCGKIGNWKNTICIFCVGEHVWHWLHSISYGKNLLPMPHHDVVFLLLTLSVNYRSTKIYT